MFAPVYAFITYPIFGLFCGYMAELFPADVRATGVNTIYNLARMMSFWGPAMLGGIAAATSYSIAIGASAVLYLCAIVPLILLPETMKSNQVAIRVEYKGQATENARLIRQNGSRDEGKIQGEALEGEIA